MPSLARLFAPMLAGDALTQASDAFLAGIVALRRFRPPTTISLSAPPPRQLQFSTRIKFWPMLFPRRA